MELFQVTLKRGEDIQAFYDDMETPGGALHIPERKVECANRRPTSRTTGYMLTIEEAKQVAADDRVEQVVPQSIIDMTKEKEEAIFTGRFAKGLAGSDYTTFTRSDGGTSQKFTADHRKWGILRHTESTNRANWGGDFFGFPLPVKYQDASVTYSASGKNVDIVIVEISTLADHEDYASRIVDYNWGQHYNTISGGANYTYSNADARDNYDQQGDHATAVTSHAAGTLYGVAIDANIYMFDKSYESSKTGDSTDYSFAYIREFHRTKSVNPATGRKNPTIVNVSLGATQLVLGASVGHFQGVTTDKGDGSTFLSEAELQAHAHYTSDSGYTSNTQFEVTHGIVDSDIQDAINEGVIVVTSAGNDNRYIDEQGGPNWDNYLVAGTNYANKDYEFSGVYPYRYYYHRGDTYSRSGGISVGSLGNLKDERKSAFSNWGPGVDVYAAGSNVIAARKKQDISQGIPYPGQESAVGTWDTIGYGQGTSYSAPYTAGVLACLAEIYPTLTQAQATTYLRDNAVTGQMYDSAQAITVDASDRVSIDGSNIDRILLWKNHRQTSGNMAFNTYNKDVNSRPTSGLMYPRVRTRRRG